MREAAKGRAGKRYQSGRAEVKADSHFRLLAIVREYRNGPQELARVWKRDAGKQVAINVWFFYRYIKIFSTNMVFL